MPKPMTKWRACIVHPYNDPYEPPAATLEESEDGIWVHDADAETAIRDAVKEAEERVIQAFLNLSLYAPASGRIHPLDVEHVRDAIEHAKEADHA